MLAWIALWIVAILVIILAIATALPAGASIGGFRPWEHIPLRWLSTMPGWALVMLMLLLGAVVHRFVVPYFGRVVRYTQATPDNIAARKNVRERDSNYSPNFTRESTSVSSLLGTVSAPSSRTI
jgi:hypothetical protein